MTQWGLDNLFNPGKRHMDDEKRRLQSTREEVGDNSGGRRIDLEGGKVSISVPRRDVIAPGPSEDPTTEADALEPVSEDGGRDGDSTPAVLDAGDEPVVALATDEIDIEPPVVRPDPDAAAMPARPTGGARSAPAARKSTVSAQTWSRRG